MEFSSGASVLIGFFGGLLGVLVGAHLSYRSISMIERKKQITDLYMIYSSSEFTVARNEAGNVMRVELHNNSSNSWSGLHNRLKENGDWEKISEVDHFFRSIYFLSQENLIDEKLTKALFREIHNHWFQNYFSIIDCASEKQETGTQSKLNKWFNKT